MKRHWCLFTIAVAAACLGSATHASAQFEKIAVRNPPRPNQTIRMRMVQEGDMKMSMEGLPAGAPPGLGAMHMVTKNIMLMTQKIGPADAQGNVTAETTFDQISAEATMNGQPSSAAPPKNPLEGQTITVVYDKQGSIVDTKLLSVSGVPMDTFKQMMESFYGKVPTAMIGIGETATVPLDFTIPLPIPGAAQQMKMNGEVKYKLVSIDKEAAGRIATFDQTTDGKLVSDLDIPGPNGAMKMSMDFKLNGTGKAVNNIDAGFVKQSESTSTITGTLRINGGANGPTNMNMSMQGIQKVTITGEN